MLENYGRYQLLKKLATGGMAQIYLARQLGMQGFEKLLVVKRILPHLAENEDFISMFLDEARIAARLNHPNVVQIFDLGQQDDTYFIAMEYIHGDDVRKVFKQAEREGTSIPLPLVCRIVTEACAGLDYAHKRTDPGGRPLNIVHRDISPQNILVSFEGGVKVVDFGIAKAADQATVTKSGVLKGKYSYMSPEQAQGRPLDARSDVFALGVVLYELLTGTRLFKRASDVQTLNAVTECKVEAPSSVNDRLPKELDAIVLKALVKDREQRYQDARSLQAALEAFMLKNKLPSSSVNLATFMQEIYAERLAREAEEGRLLFTDSSDALANPLDEPFEKATPAKQSSRSLAKVSTAGEKATPRRDSTRMEGARGPSAVKPAVQTVEIDQPFDELSKSLKTESLATQQRPRDLPWPWIVSGVLAAVGLVVLGVLLFRGGPAKVTVTSEPVGAVVKLEGKVVDCRTPCTLPTMKAGDYALELTRSGHRTLVTRLTVPASGEQTVPFVLERAEPVPVPTPVKREVALSVETEPAGATVSVDGLRRGDAPVTVALTAGKPVLVAVELEGHERVEQKVELPLGQAEVTKRFVLRPVQVGQPKVPKKDPKKEPEVRPVPMGTVRFFTDASTWASVECPPYKFGETPFGDKQLPAGEHKCTFTNTDLGKKQTKVVRVEAGEVLKVKITWD